MLSAIARRRQVAIGGRVAAHTSAWRSTGTGTEETLTTLVTRCASDKHITVSETAAVVAAMLTRATEVKEICSPSWRQDIEYVLRMPLTVINSRSALSGTSNPSSAPTSGETWLEGA